MTKQQTHSDQSVWESMVAEASKKCGRYKNVFGEPVYIENFVEGAAFTENNLKHVPKVKALVKALSEIANDTTPELSDSTNYVNCLQVARKALKDFK